MAKTPGGRKSLALKTEHEFVMYLYSVHGSNVEGFLMMNSDNPLEVPLKVYVDARIRRAVELDRRRRSRRGL